MSHSPTDPFNVLSYAIAVAFISSVTLAIAFTIRHLNRRMPICSRCLGGRLVYVRSLPPMDLRLLASEYQHDRPGFETDIDGYLACGQCRCIFDDNSATYFSIMHVDYELLNGRRDPESEWRCVRCSNRMAISEFDHESITCCHCLTTFSWQSCGSTGYQWFHVLPEQDLQV